VVSAGIRVGTRFYWMPDWFWPYLLGKETFRQWPLPDEEGRFSIDLNIQHPLFGSVFSYRGDFAIEQ